MTVRYSQLLDAVSRTTGLDTRSARVAAEAALTTLARRLAGEDRRRLVDALPAEALGDFPIEGPARGWDVVEFVREASLLGRRPLEQALERTQAVLAALAGLEPELVADLDLPEDIRALFAPVDPGGGVTGPGGHEAPLTRGEVEAALRRLPNWGGDTSALVRTVELPEDNLDRVLRRVELLRTRVGRGPHVRRGDGSADLLVYTRSVGAVTSADVELAGLVDEAIDEAGAGMAAP